MEWASHPGSATGLSKEMVRNRREGQFFQREPVGEGHYSREGILKIILLKRVIILVGIKVVFHSPFSLKYLILCSKKMTASRLTTKTSCFDSLSRHMCCCHGNVNKNKQALKIGFVYLQKIWLLDFLTVCMQQACNDAHKLTL